jgi:hypothetical protein
MATVFSGNDLVEKVFNNLSRIIQSEFSVKGEDGWRYAEKRVTNR